MAQVTTALGNTLPTPVLANFKCRKFVFTLNNYSTHEFLYIYNWCQGHTEKYIIGKEGDEKTPHLQGYVSFKNAIAFNTLKAIMPRAHIEKCKGTDAQNYKYCSKENNFVTNIELLSFKEKMIKEVMDAEYKEVKLKAWQQEVVDLKNDDRTINWYWDYAGNSGKSWLAKYLAMRDGTIICSGKKADIFNQVNVMIEAEKQPKILIADISRKDKNKISYSALEQIKNGFIYSGKYEGGKCIFPKPIVIVFANSPPEINYLSADRWNIVDIELFDL